jgi:hypothetical protein
MSKSTMQQPTETALGAAAELRAEAKAHADEARASFERCDTDGFLSQWASDLNAQLARRQAEILESGGVAEFPGLFNEAGQRVRAKLIDGRYGLCWALCDKRDKFTGTFVPFSGTGRSRKQKAMGLHEAQEVVPAYAHIVGVGTGLSGRCWVQTLRKDEGYPEDAIELA